MGVCLSAFGDSTIFDNFSQRVELIQTQGNYYQVVNTSERVYISGDVVVKTPRRVNKKSALRLHSSISEATTLYEGSEFNYFLLKLVRPESLQVTLAVLSAHESVWLAQPDILQVRETASVASAHSDSPNNYLEQWGASAYWEKSLGEGVKVAVIDDGFDLSHPDLKHVTELFSYDFSSKILNARPQFLEDRHGAMVAGVILGGHNGFGIDGLVPQAGLIALRQPDTWTSKTLLAFQLAKLAEADVINCSWTSRWLLQPVADVIQDLAKTGRNNKGLPIIFSAGNQGREIQPWSTEASLEEAIVVGASDNHGTRLRFSNYGNSVDFLVNGRPVMTTSGADGYAKFSGTSLAAAITTGYVALLLAQDNSLTLDQINDKLRQKLVSP